MRRNGSHNNMPARPITHDSSPITDREVIVYSDPQQSPGLQLWWASNALLRTIRKAIEPTGLTHAQLILLANLDYLNQREQYVTQRRLCRYSTMDENMVSQVIRSSIERRWVERTNYPGDRRAHHLELTESGRERLSEALALSRPATQAFFEKLGDEKAELTRLLRKLNEVSPSG